MTSGRSPSARLALAGPRGGALCATQHFGGSLNLNVHLHAIFLDGGYTTDVADAPPRFHAVPAPTPATLEAVATRIAARVTRLLRRRGLLVDTPAEDRSNVVEAPDALTTCLQLGVQPGRFATRAPAGADVTATQRCHGHGPWTAEVAGFNVHAGVTVAAGDRAGRERLCRYGLRPPFSAGRFTRVLDGRIAYRLGRPGPHGHRHRILEPLELMARLAALIPPPRVPQLRDHGVLAPHAAARRVVVPATPRVPRCAAHPATVSIVAPARAAPPATPPHHPSVTARTAPPTLPRARATAEAAVPAPPVRGARLAAARGGRRIDWATLLRRTFAHDPRACTRCGGRLQWIATITAPATIARILTHLGEAIERSVPTRAWDPVCWDASDV